MARKFKKSGSIKPVYRSTRRRRYGGEAQPVIVVSETTEHLESGKAEPVYVVDDAYVNRYGMKSGAAIPVVEKTNKGTISGRAKPI